MSTLTASSNVAVAALGEKISDTAMRALVEIIFRSNVHRSALDLDAITATLRAEIKSGLGALLDEAKAADEAHMGYAMVNAIIAANCQTFAIATAKAHGLL
jgi:hypothetical protein